MRYFILSLSAILILAACNKKPSVTPSRSATLRVGKWKVSGGTIVKKLPSRRDTTLQYLTYITACHLDDFIRFDSNTKGYTYSGATKCSLSDADSISFVWDMINAGTDLQSDQSLNFHNVYNMFYSVNESVLPFRFDTLSQTPLELDTLFKTPTLVLDTIWPVSFAPAVLGNTDVYSKVTAFSSTSFTIQYSVPSIYPDTVGGHRYVPVYRTDTTVFNVTYTNF